ncbi:MAG: LexA family protein [Flavisolibacter sp.]
MMDNNIFYPGSGEPSQWSSGAAGEGEPGIDLNERLIRNKQETFFMRVNSEAMSGAGIHRGDIVIVDRSLEAKNGKIIIALLDGEMLIRKLEMHQGKKRLIAATDRLAAIEIDETRFSSWGVVTYVIHGV